ncbi:MAG TPA: hypothetical protein V6D33_11380, partial [Cyanophyceae cyanobacterium]
MFHSHQEFCFATLALGSNYRELALELAKDLERYSLKKTFLVLTDKPEHFSSQRNVLAFKHKQRLYCDNDKSFLIEKALSMFDCCICIDADMRILAPIPENLGWQPGITARSCTSLIKHHQTIVNRTAKPRPSKVKQLEVIKKAAKKMDINLETQNVYWMNEFLFVVKKDGGKEVEFLDWVKRISYYIELNGVNIGIGSAMGLAATKVGFPVRRDPMKGISFFDDRIEKVKIFHGKANPDDKKAYFETLKKLKTPERTLFS